MVDLYDRLRFAEIALGGARFTETAMKALVAYAWPGNVRELKNVIERLYVCGRDRTIQARDRNFLSILSPSAGSMSSCPTLGT